MAVGSFSRAASLAMSAARTCRTSMAAIPGRSHRTASWACSSRPTNTPSQPSIATANTIRVPLTNGPIRDRSPDTVMEMSRLQWSADGRFLYVREAGNLVLRIYKLDLTTGNRQFWKESGPPDPSVLIDIGSDPGQVRMTPDGNCTPTRTGRPKANSIWRKDSDNLLTVAREV